jgi:hypothetical protein
MPALTPEKKKCIVPFSEFAVMFWFGFKGEVLPYPPRFQPLPQDNGLFLELAEVSPTTEAIEQFSQRFEFYGPNVEWFAQVLDTVTGLPSCESIPCKPSLPPVEQLKEEILAMKECVRLWQMVQANDTQKMAQYIRWQVDFEGKPFVVYVTEPVLWFEPNPAPGQTYFPVVWQTKVIASHSDNRWMLSQMTPDDLKGPAFFYLQKVITQHLMGRVTTRLLKGPGEKVGTLATIPTDILGGIWLQFAAAISGNKTFEKCRQCQLWFDLSSGKGARKDRQYCSASCKVKAYRERIGEARRLYLGGEDVKEIARRLGSDVKTIKKWIADGE